MNEKTVGSQRVFNGKLLQLEVLEVELDGGRRARREIVRHPGAVAVWARVPDGRFVFVRQFRKAIEQELLEVVAGTRDAGETWEACARREIKEETGYIVKMLAPLGSLFTAPGFCSEQIAIFYAELSDGSGTINPDPDERLEVVLLDESEWKAMLARGAIQDAKTWAAWGLFETRRRTPRDAGQATDLSRAARDDRQRTQANAQPRETRGKHPIYPALRGTSNIQRRIKNKEPKTLTDI